MKDRFLHRPQTQSFIKPVQQFSIYDDTKKFQSIVVSKKKGKPQKVPRALDACFIYIYNLYSEYILL
jgi:hypothetical protein